MNRKPWPILVGIVLVLLLAAAALWWRPRPAAPTLSPTSPLSPSPTPSPHVYRLLSTVYDTLAAANVAPAVTIRWLTCISKADLEVW